MRTGLRNFSLMNLYHHPHRERSHISTSIEFSNLPPEMPPATPWPPTAAGAHLHRRYLVPAGLADLVASLAGLDLEEARR